MFTFLMYVTMFSLVVPVFVCIPHVCLDGASSLMKKLIFSYKYLNNRINIYIRMSRCYFANFINVNIYSGKGIVKQVRYMFRISRQEVLCETFVPHFLKENYRVTTCD